MTPTQPLDIGKLKERLKARIDIETGCGNRTDNPGNHVRLLEDALASLILMAERVERYEQALREIREFDHEPERDDLSPISLAMHNARCVGQMRQLARNALSPTEDQHG